MSKKYCVTCGKKNNTTALGCQSCRDSWECNDEIPEGVACPWCGTVTDEDGQCPCTLGAETALKIDVMKIVHLCHEIQDAAKRKETKGGGTLMCAEISRKILYELLAEPIPKESDK